MILKNLNDAYANWNRQTNRPDNHLDGCQLIGKKANEGVLFNVLRGEPLNSTGARSELQSWPPFEGDHNAYRINLSMSYPTIPEYRRTMFQYVAHDGQLGTPLDVQTRYNKVRVNWLPPDGGPRRNYELPHELACDVELLIAPHYFEVNGIRVADYGIGRGGLHYFKFGCYNDSYHNWPPGLVLDWVLYHNISIDKIDP